MALCPPSHAHYPQHLRTATSPKSTATSPKSTAMDSTPGRTPAAAGVPLLTAGAGSCGLLALAPKTLLQGHTGACSCDVYVTWAWYMPLLPCLPAATSSSTLPSVVPPLSLLPQHQPPLAPIRAPCLAWRTWGLPAACTPPTQRALCTCAWAAATTPNT